MKRLLMILSVIVFFSSCTSLGSVLNTKIKEDKAQLVDKMAEEIIADDTAEEVIKDEQDASLAETEVTTPEPENNLPTSDEIIAAVKSSDLDKLIELLEDVDDVKTIIGDNVPILVMAEEAAGVNGLENPVTALLVEKGAYILQRDEKGRDFEKVIQEFEVAATPRHFYILDVIGDKKERYWKAVNEDSVDGIKELLEYLPVDLNLLFDAAHNKSTEIVRWALSEGLSVQGANSRGATVLHLACDNYTHKTFEERTELVRLLLEAGADPGAVDGGKKTALIYLMKAAQYTKGNMKETVSLLLEYGADPDDADSSGKTVLELAFMRNQMETVLLLLEKGVKPEISDNLILNMKPDEIKTFIEYGADPSSFASAINIQDKDQQADFVHYLVEAGASADAFDLVRVRENIPLLEFLVEQGADINSGNILSSYAMKYPGPEILDFLADHGADMNKKFYNEQNALHYAVKSRNLEAAGYFVEHGTEINALDGSARTPLDYCKQKDAELYNYLVEAGAKNASELQ